MKYKIIKIYINIIKKKTKNKTEKIKRKKKKKNFFSLFLHKI